MAKTGRTTQVLFFLSLAQEWRHLRKISQRNSLLYARAPERPRRLMISSLVLRGMQIDCSSKFKAETINKYGHWYRPQGPGLSLPVSSHASNPSAPMEQASTSLRIRPSHHTAKPLHAANGIRYLHSKHKSFICLNKHEDHMKTNK